MRSKLRTITLRPKTRSGSELKYQQAMVWIDRREAHIVISNNGVLTKLHITMDLPRWGDSARGLRGVSPYGKYAGYGEYNYNQLRAQRLHRFYNEVAGALAACDRIVLAGPGSTKAKLWRRLMENDALRDKVDSPPIPCGKLKDRQLELFTESCFASKDADKKKARQQ